MKVPHLSAMLVYQDLHYMAQDKGETALAEVAKRKAQQAHAESIGICSDHSVTYLCGELKHFSL